MRKPPFLEILDQNGQLLTVFGQNGQNSTFKKTRMEYFFRLSEMFQEKEMKSFRERPNERTNERTDEG